MVVGWGGGGLWFGGGRASSRPPQQGVPRRALLPPIRLHLLQRAVGGHAPQRNKQRKRRRDQHNRQLELGRVEQPQLHESVHVVALRVTQVAAWTVDKITLILQLIAECVHGGVHGAQQKRDKHKRSSAHNPQPQLPPRRSSSSSISRVHQRVVMLLLRAEAASAGRPNHSEGDNDEQQHRNLAKRLQGLGGEGKLILLALRLTKLLASAVQLAADAADAALAYSAPRRK